MMMFLSGAINSAIPVAWATWITQGVQDEPEAGGGLMVGAIQLGIMLGASFGGLLSNRVSIGATFAAGAALLGAAAITLLCSQRASRGKSTPTQEATTAEAIPAES